MRPDLWQNQRHLIFFLALTLTVFACTLGQTPPPLTAPQPASPIQVDSVLPDASQPSGVTTLRQCAHT